MKHLVFTTLLLAAFSINAQAQKNGIGLRLGEPFGITFKKYLPANKALEFIIGTGAKGWNHNYYKGAFAKNNAYDTYEYRSHKVKSLVYMQARLLFHNDINTPELDGKLQWYWGVGGALKVATVQYHYRDFGPPRANYFDNDTDIDFGPEGIIGMEYTFEDVPFSLFVDLSMLLEIIDRPDVRIFGATGARFNF